ncbi:MAG: helix-turn-helix transcriptional regulator [Coriobacteriia bacterium]|nr:helix-turn-helix transcriptional regulator [Coriobacteriia bacterium]
MENPASDPCVEFGIRLRRARLARELSQEQLANLAGLDRTYISSCEAGRRNATIRTIVRLAGALGIDPANLISDRCPDSSPHLPSEPGIARD